MKGFRAFRMILAIIGVSIMLLISCDGSGPTDKGEGGPKLILSFEFDQQKNGISVSSEARVEQNTVRIFLPTGTDVSNLIPDFTISENTTAYVNEAKVTPGETALDFSSGIEMVIRHQDGSETSYVILVTTDDSTIDGDIERMMDEYEIPGLQLAIVYKEKLVYTQSYGLANIDEELPVTNNSIFRIASVSKPITSIGILKLIEEEKLSFDDKVFGSEGVLEFDFGTPPYGSHIEEITVKHLLEHESGWTNRPFDPVFSNYDFTQDEMIDDILNNRPNSPPGQESAYLNFGYVLLGRVIEKVSEMEYGEYIKQEILTPIGVTSTEVGRNSKSEGYPNEVIYYPSENFNPYDLDVQRMDAAGGWVSSAKQLVKLLVHVDRNNRKEDLLSTTSLKYSFLNYTTWISNGGMAGTNATLSRINGDLGAAIIVNTRIPGGDITAALNDFMTEDINSRTNWPEYDLFEK